MTGLKFAIANAKQKAQETIQGSNHKSGIPVDVRALAKKFKAEVKEFEFDDNSIAGFLRRNDDGTSLIAINARNAPERQRFTIAHELGHLLLHVAETMHVDKQGTATPIYFRNDESSKATRMNEIEANQFAAELLMPIDEVLASAKKIINREPNKTIEDLVVALAESYEVSVAAMSIKLGVSAY
ncbi:MAG: ImmA/IrrE family metallo-endopeptidase [Patescibacteria group bacterium]